MNVFEIKVKLPKPRKEREIIEREEINGEGYFIERYPASAYKGSLLTYHIKCHIIGVMKYIDWDKKKNEQLKQEREISFEDILNTIEEGNLLDIVEHPNKNRYPNQKIFIVTINDYAYLVPFVEDEEKIFLKTIIPSRKATKQYIIERREK